MGDEDSEQVTQEELQEFLEADWAPVEADPAFVQRLRSRLWTLLQVRRRTRGPQSRGDRAPAGPASPPSPKHLR